MEIIQSPNKFNPKDDKDRIFIYLGGSLKKELIDYISSNISKYSIENIDKIVFFNPKKESENKTEEEIKEQIKWENEYIKKSDIFTILFDEEENYNHFYELGKYLSFFYDIYKDNLNQHFIIGYTKGFKNALYLKTQVSLSVKDFLIPIEINSFASYGDLILQKLEILYKKTDQFIDHNIIYTEQEKYWSSNLGPKIQKIYCQAPWPKSQFSIGIIGIYGIGKTCLFHWICQGRFCRNYKNCIGGSSYIYQVQMNNKNFIVNFSDTGSQEKFSCYDMLIRYLEKSNCIIFVFDITNRKSYETLKNEICPKIKNLGTNNYIKVLIGNKLDLKYDRNVTYEEADTFADEKNMKYFEVSSKSGENMEKLCNYIYNNFSKQL